MDLNANDTDLKNLKTEYPRYKKTEWKKEYSHILGDCAYSL